MRRESLKAKKDSQKFAKKVCPNTVRGKIKNRNNLRHKIHTFQIRGAESHLRRQAQKGYMTGSSEEMFSRTFRWRKPQEGLQEEQQYEADTTRAGLFAH